MFTTVEMIVIMQVLVLMWLIKLMAGQTTHSTTTGIEGLGTVPRKAEERVLLFQNG